MEFVRLASEFDDRVCLTLVAKDGSREYTNVREIATALANIYNVPCSLILERARELAKEMEIYDSFMDSLEVTILKEKAKDIKDEVKRATRKFERFIDEIIEFAIQKSDIYRLGDWLYRWMLYDVSIKRFVKA